jgi:hypothetical protein
MAQFDLLSWVSGGCEEGSYEGLREQGRRVEAVRERARREEQARAEQARESQDLRARALEVLEAVMAAAGRLALKLDCS